MLIFVFLAYVFINWNKFWNRSQQIGAEYDGRKGLSKIFRTHTLWTLQDDGKRKFFYFSSK